MFSRMDSSGVLLLAALSAGTVLLHMCSAQTVTATFNQTIVVPCNGGTPPPPGLMFIKWKYETEDGRPGDLLVKQARSAQATVTATDGYGGRVSVDERLALRIDGAALSDQRTFTCMMVSADNILEFPVTVSVAKEPSSVQVIDKSEALKENQLTTVGTCVAADSHPAAVLSWTKDGAPLVADGKGVLITSSLKVAPSSGLSTTSSSLQVAAMRQDGSSVFSCVSRHLDHQQEVPLEPFPVHYPPETIRLLVLPEGPVLEGSNVTLQCVADGNPPPRSFYFHLLDRTVLVTDGDRYTLSSISRTADGQYSCSLEDNRELQASQSLNVSYLDLSLRPSGTVVRTVGDSLSVQLEQNSSSEASVLWTKDGVPLDRPDFSQLTFSDAGLYSCQVSNRGLRRQESFQLLIQGKPLITSLTEHGTADARHRILSCEAEGVPEPHFQWSVNGTDEQRSYAAGRTVHRITVTPRLDLRVTCSARNLLGEDQRSINVSAVEEEKEERELPTASQNQTPLVTGLLIGLVVVLAAVGGLVYYMKNSRRGTLKIRETEKGTSEENSRLQENRPPR